MPQTTPRGVPYAIPTDPQAGFPDAVSKPLAEWIAGNMPVMQAGNAEYPGLSPQTQTEEYQITFPTPFPTNPRVFAQADTQRNNIAIWSITRTGFKWMARNNSSGPSGVGSMTWFAVSGTTGK